MGEPQAQFLGVSHLVDQRSRGLRRPGEDVEAEFGMGDIGSHARNVVAAVEESRIRSEACLVPNPIPATLSGPNFAAWSRRSISQSP